jgi:hypothetical protein
MNQFIRQRHAPTLNDRIHAARKAGSLTPQSSQSQPVDQEIVPGDAQSSTARLRLVVFPRYVLRGPARGPLASGPGMTVSPCRSDDLGGGVTGPEGCRRRR